MSMNETSEHSSFEEEEFISQTVIFDPSKAKKNYSRTSTSPNISKEEGKTTTDSSFNMSLEEGEIMDTPMSTSLEEGELNISLEEGEVLDSPLRELLQQREQKSAAKFGTVKRRLESKLSEQKSSISALKDTDVDTKLNISLEEGEVLDSPLSKLLQQREQKSAAKFETVKRRLESKLSEQKSSISALDDADIDTYCSDVSSINDCVSDIDRPGKESQDQELGSSESLNVHEEITLTSDDLNKNEVVSKHDMRDTSVSSQLMLSLKGNHEGNQNMLTSYSAEAGNHSIAEHSDTEMEIDAQPPESLQHIIDEMRVENFDNAGFGEASGTAEPLSSTDETTPNSRSIAAVSEFDINISLQQLNLEETEETMLLHNNHASQTTQNTQNYSLGFEILPPHSPEKPTIQKQTFKKPSYLATRRELPIRVCDLVKNGSINEFCGVQFDYVLLYGKVFPGRINDKNKKVVYRLDDGTGLIDVHYEHHSKKFVDDNQALNIVKSNASCIKKTDQQLGAALERVSAWLLQTQSKSEDLFERNSKVLVRGRPFYFKDSEKMQIKAEQMYLDNGKDRSHEIKFKQFVAQAYNKEK